MKFPPDVINYSKELPFYNTYFEKTKNKTLKNIDLFSELLFYDELSVIKTDHAFKGYAKSYKVKLIEKKYPLIKLEASKSSTKDMK